MWLNAGPFTNRILESILGDHVIASNSQTQQWTAAQNVTQSLTYPKTGVGAVITYVEIIVDQVCKLLQSSALCFVWDKIESSNKIKSWFQFRAKILGKRLSLVAELDKDRFHSLLKLTKHLSSGETPKFSDTNPTISTYKFKSLEKGPLVK